MHIKQQLVSFEQTSILRFENTTLSDWREEGNWFIWSCRWYPKVLWRYFGTIRYHFRYRLHEKIWYWSPLQRFNHKMGG
jgi:hypothetical protein